MTAGVGHLHTLVCALSFLSGQRCGVEGIRELQEGKWEEIEMSEKDLQQMEIIVSHQGAAEKGASRLGADSLYNRDSTTTISIIRTRTTLCSNTKLAIRNT